MDFSFELIRLWLCICFAITSAIGLGFPSVVLVYLLQKYPIVCILKPWNVVMDQIIGFGGGKDDHSNKVPCVLSSTQMKVTNSGHEAKNKRPIHESGKENCCSGDTEPPKKRGRKSAYTDHSCGDCTVWLQTGSNEELLKYHKRENRMRHPGDQCVGFSIFLSCQGVYKISLRSDSCLCNACHRDCLRSCGKPRWLGLSKHIVCKHCFACCKGPETCECDGINEWGPVQCNKNNEIQQRADYFQWDINVNTDQEVTMA